MPTATARASRRPDDAASYVRAMIMSGRLRPGELVRPEVIGEAIGTSPTPAREALQALRVEGFLEWRRNHGFVVAPLDATDIVDLFEVQALVAGELAARAAARLTASELSELTALHHELIAAAARSDAKALASKNHAFHRSVNLGARSRKVSWSLGLLVRYVPDQFYSEIPGWPETTVRDHKRILSSLSDRDADGAREAMATHVRNAGGLLADHFRSRFESDT